MTKNILANGTAQFVIYIIAFFFTFGCTSGINTEKAKPNILFIAIDDLRPELGCYGQSYIHTPNIDNLAAQGILFNRAYCNVPVCGASRASLMTGILPTKTRFVSHLSRADEDVPNAKTMAQVFNEAGYTTLSNGKIFHNSNDCNDRSWSVPAWVSGVDHMTNFDSTTIHELSDRGRGRIFEFPEVDDYAYNDGKVALKTIDDLRKLKKEGKPFFLACGFIRPHMPFYAPKKYWDLYQREEIVLADNRFEIEKKPSLLNSSGEYKGYHFGGYVPKTEAWHRMMRHGYFACTSYADKLTGDVLNELEKLGLAENTIVVLWGDHGWHLGEHEFWGKHNTLHNAIRIPLIVKIPGKLKGKQTDALVQSIDIFPTLCDLASLPVPESVQGKSFQAVLNDPSMSFNKTVYTRFNSMDAVVQKDFVYSLFSNGEEMLFDHRVDPQENKNVAANEAYQNEMERLRRVLNKQIEKAEKVVLPKSSSH